MSFILGASIIGGAGLLGGVAGNIIAGNAAGNAAEAQQAAATRNQLMAMQWSQPTANELDNLSQANQVAMQSVNFAQQNVGAYAQQLAALNPTIKSAFAQQYQILQGQDSPFLNPVKQQLALASQANQSRVNAQMGGGSSSSSAGAMANAQFGASAANTMQQAQIQALGALGQAGTNAVGAQSQINADALNANNSAMNSLNSAFGMSNSLQSRNINAILGTGNQVIQNSGSQYAGQLYGGQALASTGKSLLGTGGALALYGAFGGMQTPAASMGITPNTNNLFAGGSTIPGAVPGQMFG